MMLETPTTIKKTMSRKDLLKLEWALNELGKDEVVDRLGEELDEEEEIEDNADI